MWAPTSLCRMGAARTTRPLRLTTRPDEKDGPVNRYSVSLIWVEVLLNGRDTGMPLYPTPGLGISTSGLNKVDGWGSVNPATGQVFAGHAGDQGIDHKAGLSLAGLDVAGNPFITNPAESAIT